MNKLFRKLLLHFLRKCILLGIGNFIGLSYKGKSSALATVPFYELRPKEIKKKHANYFNASLLFAATLKASKSVDVYNIKYMFRQTGVSTSYDFVIGFSHTYRKLCKKNPNAKKILWFVEAYPKDLHQVEEQRAQRLSNKLGRKAIRVSFRSNKYYLPEDIYDADVIFCFGEKNKARLKTLTNAHVVHVNRPPGQEVAKAAWPNPRARGCFCFCGSGGWLLKGLDIVAEASSSGDIGVVHICAPKKYARHSFLTNKYTQYHGLISPNSRHFEALVSCSRFSILMSCGEGMPGAILTTMSVGLIPVISEHCGSGFGDLAVQLTEEEIEAGHLRHVIKKMQGLSDSELEVWSRKCRDFAMKMDQPQAFIDHVSNELARIVC